MNKKSMLNSHLCFSALHVNTSFA